mmetsp:Transcript_23667/g.75749  ORF Transcript_23667/g.75749 Transcript_23667/m.75749 type:complete len:210 (-) Transcript_23667:709-1338(-)
MPTTTPIFRTPAARARAAPAQGSSSRARWTPPRAASCRRSRRPPAGSSRAPPSQPRTASSRPTRRTTCTERCHCSRSRSAGRRTHRNPSTYAAGPPKEASARRLDGPRRHLRCPYLLPHTRFQAPDSRHERGRRPREAPVPWHAPCASPRTRHDHAVHCMLHTLLLPRRIEHGVSRTLSLKHYGSRKSYIEPYTVPILYTGHPLFARGS